MYEHLLTVFPLFLFSRAFNSLLIVFFVSPETLLSSCVFSIIYFVNVCVPISLWRHSHQVTGLVFFSFSPVVLLRILIHIVYTHTFFIISSFPSCSIPLSLRLHDENICTWFAAGDLRYGRWWWWCWCHYCYTYNSICVCIHSWFVNGITYAAYIHSTLFFSLPSIFPIQNSLYQKKWKCFSMFHCCIKNERILKELLKTHKNALYIRDGIYIMGI